MCLGHSSRNWHRPPAWTYSVAALWLLPYVLAATTVQLQPTLQVWAMTRHLSLRNQTPPLRNAVTPHPATATHTPATPLTDHREGMLCRKWMAVQKWSGRSLSSPRACCSCSMAAATLPQTSSHRLLAAPLAPVRPGPRLAEMQSAHVAGMLLVRQQAPANHASHLTAAPRCTQGCQKRRRYPPLPCSSSWQWWSCPATTGRTADAGSWPTASQNPA